MLCMLCCLCPLCEQGELFIIDVSQAVDLDHPKALDFLREDCKHINDYFRRSGEQPGMSHAATCMHVQAHTWGHVLCAVLPNEDCKHINDYFC